MSVLACGRRLLQASAILGAQILAYEFERVHYLEMAKGERKAGGGRVTSCKYFRREENYSSCQYPARLARCPARLGFLVTYVDSRFGISGARLKSAEPLRSFSSPGSGGRGPPKTGIGDRKQDQSFKILLYRAGSGVFSHPCADK